VDGHGGWFPQPVISPANNEQVDEVLCAGVRDAEAAATAARDRTWASLTAERRSELLHDWSGAVAAAREELADLISADSGKPIRQARGEAEASAAAIRYFAGAADKPSGAHPPQVLPGWALVFREPIGTVAAITPWNAPAFAPAHKSAGALAAGNNVILKPSPLAPRAALLLGRLALTAGIEPPALQVLPGGPELARALITSPDIEGVSFTGSTETGRLVSTQAAPLFKRVVLELGGKSPSVVFADADLAAAAASTVWGVFDINGEDCCARSRILVQRSAFEPFLEALRQETEQLVVGDPFDERTDVGPLISREHRARVEGFLDPQACGPEARIYGGRRPDAPELQSGNYLSPAVVANPELRGPLVTSEVFGPVASVIPFDDEAEAIALANDTSYGLAASLWTSDLKRAMRVVNAFDCGQVSVNTDTSVRIQLPFGGVKESGLGRELGVHGMTAFQREKTVSLSLAP
jgi:acyl-CoA reductase-like NAD-dependent aldehyde dehydrogenase